MVGGPNATGLVKNDAVSVVTEDIVVCGTCGSGSLSQLIAKCARCNDYEHGYCMKVLTSDIPREWYCAKCQEYANGGPKPSQGGQTEFQKPRHGRDMMNERETSKLHLSHSNVVPQISPKSPNRCGNAKVKFVSSEEAALLSRERPPLVRSRFAVPQPSKAPSTTKHLSNLNCVSPSRSDTQVQALTRCADASHSQTKIEDRSYFAMQQRQVHPASPPGMKQPSNMKSISPSRSDTQVQNLKRCAAARHGQAKTDDSPYFAMRQSQAHPASPLHVKQLSNMKRISPNRTVTQVHGTKRSTAVSHDINMDFETRSGGSMPIIHKCRTSERVKVKIDSLIEHKAREKKIVNADKGETNSLAEGKPLCASNDDTGCSLNGNKGVMLTIGSIVKYSRRPAPAICWRGCFHVFYAGTKLNLGEFKAQFPSKVSSRVCDTIKMIPSDLQLELLPRMNDWPKSFETIPPVHEDIGVFFFLDKPIGCEKKHSNILADSNNYVLRAYIDGIKLLIYSSEVLPPDSQWIDGENYLWGLFVRSKGKSDPWQFGSTTA
ncbi:ASI1-immunoprecipitated protein 2-like [Miscanthus floridulus]|uniref:ASI1-immunoprecipitated protein 2-like n=1 Tax=Miscanthus floridulus TaxID=154761 RepID=UPI0034596614